MRRPRGACLWVAGCLGFSASLGAPAWGATPVVRTLENGLKVGVFSDHRLPVVQIQVMVPAGAAQELPREHGAAKLAALLLTRATTSRSATDYSAEVERLGGTVASNASLEYATLGGAFRVADFEHGIELVADAVMNPLFSDAEIAQARSEAVTALLQSRRQLGLVADEHVRAGVMRGHPYGVPEHGTIEGVAGLTRGQIQDFHRECYRPDRAMVAIAGGVDPERAFAAAQEHFGEWKGRARAPVAAPATSEGFAIRIVDAPGATGAEIRLGVRVPARRSAESYALVVANDLLGASPSSRLNAGAGGRVLRAYTTLSLQGEAGLLVLGAAARNDSVPAMVARLRSELERFSSDPPAEAEVAASRRSLARAFPLLNESLGLQAAQWLTAAFHGLQDDHVERYPERLQEVTAADVRRTSRRWLAPSRSMLVVVGAASELEPGLEALGPVEVVPLTAPAIEIAKPPGMDTSPPTAEELERGRQLVGQALAAHGGLAKLKGIEDSTVESDLQLHSGGQTLPGTQKRMLRDGRRLRMETTLLETIWVRVLDGEAGWARASTAPDSIMDEDSLGVAELKGEYDGDPLAVLWAAADPGTRPAWRGEEKIGARPADVVEMVTVEGRRSVLFLDRERHHLAAVEENQGSPLAGPTLRRIYGDYRPVQGILWPHFEERRVDGARILTVRTKRVLFNTGLPAAAFEKPGPGGDRHRRR